MTGPHRDGLNPTRKLPAVGAEADYHGHPTDPFGVGQTVPQPLPNRPRRWIWPLIGATAILATCVAIALLIVDSSEQQTMVAPPLPPAPDTADTIPTSAAAVAAAPTTAASPEPTETETVRYTVSGTGRAMSITYVDTGDVRQTEFNVPLPWTREVQLNLPAKRSASISIVNAGRPVTCAISINGNQIQQRDGIGLTICRTVRHGPGHPQEP